MFSVVSIKFLEVGYHCRNPAYTVLPYANTAGDAT